MLSLRVALVAVLLIAGTVLFVARLRPAAPVASAGTLEPPEPEEVVRPTVELAPVERAVASEATSRQEVTTTAGAPLAPEAPPSGFEIRVLDEEDHPLGGIEVAIASLDSELLDATLAGFDPEDPTFDKASDLRWLCQVVDDPKVFVTSEAGLVRSRDSSLTGWMLVYVTNAAFASGELHASVDSTALVHLRSWDRDRRCILRVQREPHGPEEGFLCAVVQEAGTGIRVDQALVDVRRDGEWFGCARTGLDGLATFGPVLDDEGWTMQARPTSATTPSVQASTEVSVGFGERVLVEMPSAPWIVVTTVDARTGREVTASRVSITAGTVENEPFWTFLTPNASRFEVLGLQDRPLAVWAQDENGRCALVEGVVPTRSGKEVTLELEPAASLDVDVRRTGVTLVTFERDERWQRHAKAASGMIVADSLRSPGIYRFGLPPGGYRMKGYLCCEGKLVLRFVRGVELLPGAHEYVELRGDCEGTYDSLRPSAWTLILFLDGR